MVDDELNVVFDSSITRCIDYMVAMITKGALGIVVGGHRKLVKFNI